MSLDFERGGDNCRIDYVSNELITAKETFELHLSAGILVPEEICNAERVLRRLNRIAESQIGSMSALEKIPA